MEKYSVLMSVYYKEQPDWFDEAINSMIKQTVPPDEFVIVKDGELTEALNNVIDRYTEKYPELFRIVALPENKGLGPALLTGVMACKNEIIARMDSDDISLPTRCFEELFELESDESLMIVGSWVNEFCGGTDNIIALRKLPCSNADIKEFARKRCPFAHPSVMYRKSAVTAAGNYRDYPYFEDYDLWIRMIKNGYECKNIDKPLVYMRVNDDFYRRRGGVKYLKKVLRFKREQYKSGFYSFKDYFVSAGAHCVVCLMPNFMRDFVYKKLLRSKNKGR